MSKRRIYGLPDDWECSCGCGDYTSYPLRAEVHKRQAQVLGDKGFMNGAREALANHLRGDTPVPSGGLKRKYVPDTTEC